MTKAESFRPHRASLALVFILLVQLAIVCSTPKGVSWDPSYGLLAAQQQLAGISPSIFTLVEVDPANITHLNATPVSYWAPAYQAIPYILRFGSLNWGMALNLTLGLILLSGSLGWLIYFAQVFASLELACWLSAVLALTRFRWTMALTYDGGDQLIWAASPWVLIFAAAALRLAQRGEPGSAATFSALAGATGASLFTLKYSGIFISIGVGVVFSALCIKRRHWQVASFAGLAFVTVLGVIFLAGFPQGITPAAPTRKTDIFHSLAAFGMPAIGVTDLDPILRPLVSNTALSDALTVSFIGVGLTLITIIGFALYITSRPVPRFNGDCLLAQLAIGAVIADVSIFFLLMLNGANTSPSGRFGRVSGLLLLPILMTGWRIMLREQRLIWRGFAVLSAAIFLVLPVTLATARQLPILLDRLWNAETDFNGVVNIALTPGTDAQAFYSEVESVSRDSVLYTIYPRMAFALPRRPLILVEAEEQETPTTLLKRRYRGRPARGIALLLPAAFQYNGKFDAIKSSFIDIQNFSRHELRTDPKWALWVSTY